jgi:hypothetical protein
MSICITRLISLKTDIGCPIDRYHESEISNCVIALAAAGDMTFRPNLARTCGRTKSQAQRNPHCQYNEISPRTHHYTRSIFYATTVSQLIQLLQQD